MAALRAGLPVMITLPHAEETVMILSRFAILPERDRRTDGHNIATSISRE